MLRVKKLISYQKSQIFGLLTLALALALPSALQASERVSVGVIDALKGDAQIIRAGAETMETAQINAPVYRHDIIQTGANSKIRLKFADESLVSIGANGTLKISKYVYSAERNERSSFFTIPEGIFRVVVSKFMPNSQFEVQTATAVSAVRGTDWMGLASPSSTAIFVSRGAVLVKSGNQNINGEVILTQGEGTAVALDEPLAPKKKWGQAKVSDFQARTSVD